MSWEKTGKFEDIIHWPSDMEVEKHVYTLGLSGEKFFKELMENGKIVAGKCSNCGKLYLPPRSFCIHCFGEIKEYVDVGLRGKVKSYTIVSVDMDNKPLETPKVIGFIEFPGVIGGLIHFINVKPEEIRIGMEVEAVLKPKEERKGNIMDILYFKPT